MKASNCKNGLSFVESYFLFSFFNDFNPQSYINRASYWLLEWLEGEGGEAKKISFLSHLLPHLAVKVDNFTKQALIYLPNLTTKWGS